MIEHGRTALLVPSIEHMRQLVDNQGFHPLDCVLSVIEHQLLETYTGAENGDMLAICNGILAGLLMSVHEPTLAGTILEYMSVENPNSMADTRALLEAATNIYNRLIS